MSGVKHNKVFLTSFICYLIDWNSLNCTNSKNTSFSKTSKNLPIVPIRSFLPKNTSNMCHLLNTIYRWSSTLKNSNTRVTRYCLFYHKPSASLPFYCYWSDRNTAKYQIAPTAPQTLEEYPRDHFFNFGYECVWYMNYLLLPTRSQSSETATAANARTHVRICLM